MKLTRNVGTIDRIMRLVAGVVLGGVFLAGIVAAPSSYVLAVLAVVMLATAALGYCPIYAILGVRTCPLQRA
jgi:amino acid transporter